MQQPDASVVVPGRARDNCLVLPACGPWLRRNQLRGILEAAGCAGIRDVLKQTGAQHNTGYVRFLSDAHLDAALARFPLPREGGKPLTAKLASRDDSFWTQRQGGEVKAQQQHQQQRHLPLLPAAQCPDVHSVITPLAHVPYLQQLEEKQVGLRSSLGSFVEGLVAALEQDVALTAGPVQEDGGAASAASAAAASASASSASSSAPSADACAGAAAAPPPAARAPASLKRPRADGRSALDKLSSPHLPADFHWLRAAAAQHGGLPCELGPLVASPVQEGYRNKAEFTIGRGADGLPAVGFKLSGYASGGAQMPVGSAPSYRNVPAEISRVRAAAEEFFKTSALPPYCTASHTGVWRVLSVKWSHASTSAQVELMASPPGARSSDSGSSSSSSSSSRSSGGSSAEHAAESAPVEGEGGAGAAAAEASPAAATDTAAAAALPEGGSGAGAAASADAAPPPPPPPAAAPSDASASASATCGATSGAEAAALYQRELLRFQGAMLAEGLRVASIYVQEYSGSSIPLVNHPRTLLHGAPALLERLPHCNLSYRVSPGAFAQVNTSAADALYFLARSLAIDGAGGARALLAGGGGGGGGGVGAAVDFTQLPSTRRELCILDICCGGGLLGLNCSPYVGCVAGVDVAEASIADARANSALNGVPEAAAAWVCGRAESAMEAVLAGARARGATAFTAIVDPPRSGLHPAVVRALRTLKGQRRLVYVSCNAASFVGDAVKLTCPQRKQQAFARGPPFRLVYVVGVDLFPHTRGVEVVGLFERDS